MVSFNFCCAFAKRALALIIPVLFLTACQTDLYTKLTESEANEMVALLLRNSVSATRVTAKDGTSVVRIDEGSFADAVSLLNDAGLPRAKFATMGEVFADTKLISSPIEERARFIYALSQEISKTLTEIDGVIAARVHLVLPQNDPFREDTKPSSASVFIKHDSSISVTPLLPQIKTLVMNSVEGLSYDKISVVFFAAAPTHKISIITHPQNTSVAASFSQWLFTFGSSYNVLIFLALGGGILLIYLYNLRKQGGSLFSRQAPSQNLSVEPPGKPEVY